MCSLNSPTHCHQTRLFIREGLNACVSKGLDCWSLTIGGFSRGGFPWHDWGSLQHCVRGVFSNPTYLIFSRWLGITWWTDFICFKTTNWAEKKELFEDQWPWITKKYHVVYLLMWAGCLFMRYVLSKPIMFQTSFWVVFNYRINHRDSLSLVNAVFILFFGKNSVNME